MRVPSAYCANNRREATKGTTAPCLRTHVSKSAYSKRAAWQDLARQAEASGALQTHCKLLSGSLQLSSNAFHTFKLPAQTALSKEL